MSWRKGSTLCMYWVLCSCNWDLVLVMIMECNRDEALRSRCMAEQKFLQHDLVGVKKLALKAQCLFPDLEGLPQLMAVLDVHIMAQQNVEGREVNWYRILQTDASADEVTIRKQYRKLALILHPDKNKAIGAEGAFKLISEAWRVLSDKDKKAAHDAKRNSNAFDFHARKPTNGFCNFTHFSGCSKPRPADSSKKSFWTGCPSCKMQFEYMRVHENKRISCPTCGKSFRATELLDTEPRSRTQPSEPLFRAPGSSCSVKQTRKDSDTPVHVGSGFSFYWGTHKFNAATNAAAESATAQMVQQTYETVRRERIKAQREAREKAAMERMEAEIEAKRRERKERKQGRKGQRDQTAQASAHPNGNLENIAAMEPRSSRDLESGRTDAACYLSNEGVDTGAAGPSSSDGVNDAKEFGSCLGEKVARLDHVQEPFRCGIRKSFDPSNSYDSSDAFSFSKRLKVDV